MIKSIKEQWSGMDQIEGLSGKKQFRVFDFGGNIGKCVVVVINDHYMDRFVVGLVQVSTGINLIENHSRPCDNMDDAVDVADEMLTSVINSGELKL